MVTIPVDYSGPDLAEVAERTGMSPDEVVAAHTGQVWTVAFCGFAPGFGYLVGEHDTAAGAPARPTADHRPRRRGRAGGRVLRHLPPVRARRLAADRAHRPPSLWDLDRDPPALLQPGAGCGSSHR